MSPDDVRRQHLVRRCQVGTIWFLVEACVLWAVIQLASSDRVLVAWPIGVFLILFCYLEGRLRK